MTPPSAKVPSGVAGPPLTLAPCVSLKSTSLKLIVPPMEAAASSPRLPAWTPLVIESSPLADELRGMRSAFLSQHLFKTYSGYVLSQFRRMAAAVRGGGSYKPKHAMHLVRLLHSGIHALQTGEILVDVSSRREALLRIKHGELTFDEVKQKALALEREFQAAFEITTLPEQPEFARVNDFLIRARRSMVDV